MKLNSEGLAQYISNKSSVMTFGVIGVFAIALSVWQAAIITHLQPSTSSAAVAGAYNTNLGVPIKKGQLFRAKIEQKELGYIVELSSDPLMESQRSFKESTFKTQSNQYLVSLKSEKSRVKNELAKLATKEGKTFSLKQIKSEYNLGFNGFSIQTTSDVADKIKNIPGVKAVYPNTSVYAEAIDSARITGSSELNTLDASGGSCKKTPDTCIQGNGVRVAILDTGADLTVQDLGGTGKTEPWLTKANEQPLDFYAISNEKSVTQDGSRLAYIAGANTVYLKEGGVEQRLNLDPAALVIKTIILKDNTLLYTAFTQDTETELHGVYIFTYNLQTKQNRKYFDSYQFVRIIFADENNLVASYADLQTQKITLARISLSTGTVEVLSQGAPNQAYYPILYNGIIYDTLLTFDSEGYATAASVISYPPRGSKIATRNIPLPVSSILLDIQGDNWLINPRGRNPDPYTNYILYNTSTKKLTNIPSFLTGPTKDAGALFSFYVNGVTGLTPRIVENKVVYAAHGFEPGDIWVFDLTTKQQIAINPLSQSTSFDIGKDSICLTSVKGSIQCIAISALGKVQSITSLYNAKIVGGYNFMRPNALPQDGNGHGTHVAATLLTIAPRANVYIYKVLSNTGAGDSATIMTALEKAADPNGDGDTSDKMQVISMSLGGSGNSDDPLSRTVDRLSASGIVVVVAAGNSGPGGNSICRSESSGNGETQSICSPGTAKSALTVAAVDKQDYLANFSSRGPALSPSSGPVAKPDIAAPGVDICAASLGALPLPYLFCRDNQHISFSGTSMATPMVAGAAALLLQMRPESTSSAVKELLKKYSKPLNYNANQIGAGRLELRNLLK